MNEQIINGVLMERADWTKPWRQVSIEAMSRRLMACTDSKNTIPEIEPMINFTVSEKEGEIEHEGKLYLQYVTPNGGSLSIELACYGRMEQDALEDGQNALEYLRKLLE